MIIHVSGRISEAATCFSQGQQTTAAPPDFLNKCRDPVIDERRREWLAPPQAPSLNPELYSALFVRTREVKA